MPCQPNRRFSESPYVESLEDVLERGDRYADPLPGGSQSYPAAPITAHAASGLAFADVSLRDADGETQRTVPARSDDSDADSETDTLLLPASLMVDPESMDAEYAARGAAVSKREALFLLDGGERRLDSDAPRKSREASARDVTRAGLDPMYPVIDYSVEHEGEDDLDERVDEIVEKYETAARASS
jgi:hypothetical protein